MFRAASVCWKFKIDDSTTSECEGRNECVSKGAAVWVASIQEGRAWLEAWHCQGRLSHFAQRCHNIEIDKDDTGNISEKQERGGRLRVTAVDKTLQCVHAGPWLNKCGESGARVYVARMIRITTTHDQKDGWSSTEEYKPWFWSPFVHRTPEVFPDPGSYKETSNWVRDYPRPLLSKVRSQSCGLFILLRMLS